jgi:hypothetical protein
VQPAQGQAPPQQLNPAPAPAPAPAAPAPQPVAQPAPAPAGAAQGTDLSKCKQLGIDATGNVVCRD